MTGEPSSRIPRSPPSSSSSRRRLLVLLRPDFRALRTPTPPPQWKSRRVTPSLARWPQLRPSEQFHSDIVTRRGQSPYHAASPFGEIRDLGRGRLRRKNDGA